MEKQIHSKNCKYNNESNMLYAYWKPDGENFRLIAATEIALFDTYLEKSKSHSVFIDYEKNDNLPYKIVYGLFMIQHSVENKEALEYADKMKGYALADLTEEEVNISCYDDIAYFDAEDTMNIPFAALIKTPHELKNMDTSITLFPMTDDDVLDSMLNRPFLLACREADEIESLNLENWKNYVDNEKALEVAKRADLFTGETESPFYEDEEIEIFSIMDDQEEFPLTYWYRIRMKKNGKVFKNLDIRNLDIYKKNKPSHFDIVKRRNETIPSLIKKAIKKNEIEF